LHQRASADLRGVQWRSWSCLDLVQKKNRQAVGAGGFSGCLGANLAQFLRQRLGKSVKVKPESVGVVHFKCLRLGFKHEYCPLGKY
jgi:hypothetical protein